MIYREELMNRVRTVRIVRSLLGSPLAGAFFAAVFLVCISIFVSIGDVVRNILVQGEWSGRFSYTYSSLMHSRITVQILACLTLISFLIMLARSVRHIRVPIYFIANFISSISPLKFFRS